MLGGIRMIDKWFDSLFSVIRTTVLVPKFDPILIISLNERTILELATNYVAPVRRLSALDLDNSSTIFGFEVHEKHGNEERFPEDKTQLVSTIIIAHFFMQCTIDDDPLNRNIHLLPELKGLTIVFQNGLIFSMMVTQMFHLDSLITKNADAWVFKRTEPKYELCLDVR